VHGWRVLPAHQPGNFSPTTCRRHVIAIVLANLAVVLTAVVIHYEFLFRLTLLLPKVKIRHRLRVL
jgi:hypothetical protein